VTRRYVALGDSYTIGEGVSASERWPAQLAAALRRRGVPIAEPVIVASTGWTTSDLLTALDSISSPLPRSFDLVSLLIGVNDQYRGLGVHVFRDGFEKLLSRALEYAGGEARHVIVVSIPDWGVTPFAAADPRGSIAIGGEINQFNAIVRDAARQAETAFVDVTPLSRQAATDRALLAPDGLHPSGAMYASWVELLEPVAVRALN
jgi:lysophospholipase L1-like esterase